MTMIQRHMLLGGLATTGFSLILVAITLVTFPVQSWSMVWEKEVMDVPFLVFVGGASIGTGLFGGFLYGWFWRTRLNRIDLALDGLLKGHKQRSFEEENVAEIQNIYSQVERLHLKANQQAEQAQRLATQRANEREKSLQEVIIQERSRLARELHDSVSQQLFAASMMMSAINEEGLAQDETLNKQLSMVENMIHQSQLEMRALLLHLRPVPLRGKSLSEGMEELLLELTQKVPMTIDWKIENMDLDKGVEDQLFRIIQEAVSNTLRHAGAHSLHAMLIERDQTVILRIVDDGKGFNVEHEKTSSYGIQNMQERAAEVGGNMKVISIPDQGTRIEVKVPVLRKEENKGD